MTAEFNFAEEMARIHPALMREVMSRQQNIFTKGNLTFTNIIILDALAEKGTLTMSEIARILHMTMGAATGVIDKMVGQEQAERGRSEEDRRVVNVKLTQKGKTLSKKVDEDRLKITDDIYSPLSVAEKKELLRMFKKVLQGQ